MADNQVIQSVRVTITMYECGLRRLNKCYFITMEDDDEEEREEK